MAGWQRTSQVRRGREWRAGIRTAHAVRLLGAVIVLLGFTGVVTAGVAQASRTGTAASSGWKVERTPNQNRDAAAINELSAVSCTSGRACTAVGSHAASLSSTGFPLAERWNGTRWQIQPTVLPPGAKSGGLAGVSCASATACTAVGSTPGKAADTSVSLAEVWNGTRWRVQAIPAPKGSTSSALFGVSCTAPNACTAVGHYSTAAGRMLALAERWNGARWAIQPVPGPLGAASEQFSGVSCSAARACTAVGDQTGGSAGTRPVAKAWNGTRWHSQTVPIPRGSPGGILAAVSCTSARACTATGANFSPTGPTLAVRWNGTRWRVQATPSPANSSTSHEEVTLNGVSCASATACTATGAYAPGGHSAYFLEAWNGRSWRLVRAPHPAGFLSGALNGISCAAARCTAVGAWSGGPIFVATLAMAN
jgi:hypothetical protein